MTPALAPWGIDVLARAQALRAPGVPHTNWRVLAVRDNLVLANKNAVAKVARPGGEARISTGLRTALSLADTGVPVVHPLAPMVISTELGPTTFWPRITHTPLNAATMPVAAAHAFGAALGAISAAGQPAPLDWNPFARLTARVAAGASWAAPEDLRRVEALAASACSWASDVGVGQTGVLAHGDVSLTNALWTDAGIRLIDFDSAASAPHGWDLACLLLRLTVEGHNPTAAAAVRAGWATHARPPDPRTLAALITVKLVMGTSFLLTLGHDAHARELFPRRLGELEAHVRERSTPPKVTPLD